MPGRPDRLARRRNSGLLLGAAVIALATLVPTTAPAQIPETFTNLQVLPKEIERRALIDAMRDFASALGVRCNHCHVGGDLLTLEGFDFASDELETKRVARAMARMTHEINERLLPTAGRESPLPVTCITCHHRQTRPQTLDQVLRSALDEGGVAAAVARYRELRQQTYGRGVFDFGEFTLANLANQVAEERHDLAGAVTLLELNLELHPESAQTHYLLGEAALQAGDETAARTHLERAVALAPDHRGAVRRLEALRRAAAPP